jgi:hypothetical protein
MVLYYCGIFFGLSPSSPPLRFEGWLFPRNVVVEKHGDDGESPKKYISVKLLSYLYV